MTTGACAPVFFYLVGRCFIEKPKALLLWRNEQVSVFDAKR